MKKLFTFLSFLMLYLISTNFSSIMAQSNSEAKLIYIGDPMCSWCYGFSPELQKVIEHFGEKLELELVMGGLRPYNTQTMADLGDFLKKHWEEVGNRSGQNFSFDILEDNTFVYDTEPACRAVVLANDLDPKLGWTFFKCLQEAFYSEGKDPKVLSTSLEIANALEFKFIPEFKEAFNSEEAKQTVRQDFERSGEMGVRGFPTVILEKEGQLHLLSNGYQNAEALINSINEILD